MRDKSKKIFYDYINLAFTFIYCFIVSNPGALLDVADDDDRDPADASAGRAGRSHIRQA